MEIVNPVPVEEVREWLAQLVTTLLHSPYDDTFEAAVERRCRAWVPERSWGYRDGGRWVATLASDARVLTVPGPGGAATRDVPADALTQVTVAATHRRQGLLTAMITRSLRAAKERGDVLSMLLAAEWPIYGRFGYAPAVFAGDYAYYPRRPNAQLPPPAPGRVRQVEPDEVASVAPAVFDRARRDRAGQVDRPGTWWERTLGTDGLKPRSQPVNWVLHDGPDGPDGLLAWRPARDGSLLTGDLAAIEVSNFAATGDEAYRDLWGYLAALDLVEEIRLAERPLDEPVRWLLRDGRALTTKATYDFLWVRLLDVPAALSARGYATGGRLVLDVVDDDLGGYGAGRVALEVGPDGVGTCTATSEPAELRLSQRALATAYLGGSRLTHRQIAGDVEELRSGALARADVLFATPLAPWCQTGF